MSNGKTIYNDEQLYYSLTYEDMVRIFKLINDYQYRNLNIELGDLKLQIDKSGVNSIEKDDDIQASSSTSSSEEQKEKAVPEIEESTVLNHNKENLDETEDNSEKSDIEMDGFVPVHTSIAGVFYEAPSPGEEPFVMVGSKVKKGDELGLIEVMKLFNSINAPCDGVIKEIHVEDQSVVNVEDVLMVIEPI
ncbi:acetyl-CoA carboxylase biotin carboxyl carrier protein [Virgibacillus natechei]|uniref:acetyl-CoA carboxylase biotin carboxyl carrier protein n=1 Tax=Virgibacillus sp. CBA3643 TaxID=2942278 RepID=UPI0035A3A937